LLPPSVYGELALDLSIAALLAQVVVAPIGHASERYLAASLEGGHFSSFIASLRRMVRTSALIVVAIGLAMSVCAWWIAPERALSFALSATILALLTGLESVIDSSQNAARHRVVVAAHQGLRAWLRPVCVAMLVLVVGPSSVAAVLGYTVASAIVLLSQYVAFRRFRPGVGTTCEDRDLYGEMIRYATPFALWGLLAWTQLSSDRWALQIFTNLEQVGLYSIVYQLGAYPMTVITTVLSQLFAPIIFARAGNASDRARAGNAMGMVFLLAASLVLITFVVTGIAWVGHDVIFATLVGPEYRSVSYLLPLAVLGSGLLGAGQVFGWIALVVHRPRLLLPPRIGATVLTLLLNGAGAYAFGITGVLLAQVASAIVYAGWTLLACLDMARAVIGFPTERRVRGG
jgi:O-antigen/teichoic acid export membrane protein